MEKLLNYQPIRKQYSYFLNCDWPAVKFLYLVRLPISLDDFVEKFSAEFNLTTADNLKMRA